MARLGSSGIGDSSCHCLGAGMLGLVLAVAAGHAAATVSHSAAASWVHAACLFCHRDCSSPARIIARSACYCYPSDSSCTTQWVSKSGIVGCIVCLTYRAGVSVVHFTRDRAGSTLHSHSYGVHSYSVKVYASDRHSSLPEFGCYL